MQFLRTLFWVLLAGVAVAFAFNNWTTVPLRLWGGLIADVNLPLLLALAFLAGFLPMLLANKATRWRWKQRVNGLERTVADLTKKGRSIKQPMQRYKGLGEMDAHQLAETTMDPEQRTLRRVTMADAEAAERVFDLLMGSDVAPRKDFLISSADQLERERIDA